MTVRKNNRRGFVGAGAATLLSVAVAFGAKDGMNGGKGSRFPKMGTGPTGTGPAKHL